MMIKKRVNMLSDTAYERIKTGIVTGALEPGQFIAQAELAEHYEVGTTPVREALRRLALEGFVRAVPRMGYIVSQITAQDIHEIYELRLVLEVASARLAAERALPALLDQIDQASNTTYTFKERQSYISFLTQNAHFHISIAAATGNQRLTLAVGRVMDELMRIFHLGLDLRDSAEEMRRDHRLLYEALRRRDPDAAEQCVRAEILLSQERVLEAVKSYPSATPLKGDIYG